MEIKCVFMDIKGGNACLPGSENQIPQVPRQRKSAPLTTCPRMSTLTRDPRPRAAPRHGDPAVPFSPLHFERRGVITHNFFI